MFYLLIMCLSLCLVLIICVKEVEMPEVVGFYRLLLPI